MFVSRRSGSYEGLENECACFTYNYDTLLGKGDRLFRLGFDGRTIGLRFDAERRTSLIKNIKIKEIFVILTVLKMRFDFFFKCTLNDLGDTVTPAWPQRSGSSAPSGSSRLKTWSIDEKKRKSSALAKTSPKHIRLPTPNGMKKSGRTVFVPSSLRNRSGLNCSGSFHKVGSM